MSIKRKIGANMSLFFEKIFHRGADPWILSSHENGMQVADILHQYGIVNKLFTVGTLSFSWTSFWGTSQVL